jgi:hypothetical protein
MFVLFLHLALGLLIKHVVKLEMKMIIIIIIALVIIGLVINHRCCLHYQDIFVLGSGRLLRNFGIYVQDCTTSHQRRP